MENVLDESHDFSYCRQRAKENEEKTGNKTYVRHIGTRTSGLTELQHFIIVEIIKTQD